MPELTLERPVRPGVWRGALEGRAVLVRQIPPERCSVYEAAQALPLPVPSICYVGPDVAGERHVVVQEWLGAEDGGDRADAWRPLAAVGPLFRGDPARLAVGLTRALEAVAWLHAAGFWHGYLTPRTIWLHPRGLVLLAGLDCLQRAGPLVVPCIAYTRAYPCLEQVEGWLHVATDVRLLALAFAERFLGHHPLAESGLPAEPDAEVLARRAIQLAPGPRVLGLLEAMSAVEPGDRPDLRDVLAELRRA